MGPVELRCRADKRQVNAASSDKASAGGAIGRPHAPDKLVDDAVFHDAGGHDGRQLQRHWGGARRRLI